METLTQSDALNLLSKMQVVINAQNLVYYAQQGDSNKVRLLLAAGIDPNLPFFNKELKKDVLPLHNTIGFGQPAIANMLIEHGADINKLDTEGYAPIDYAIQQKRIDSVKLLIANEANLNQINGRGIKPLYEATQAGNADIVSALKSAGAESMTENDWKKMKELNVVNRFKSAVFSKDHLFGKAIVILLILMSIFWISDYRNEPVSIYQNALGVGAFLAFIAGWVLLRGRVNISYNMSKKFTIYALVLLSFNFSLSKSNEGYVASSSGGRSGGSLGTNSEHQCDYCSQTYNGNGWMTIGGEQYKQSSYSGAGYCSRRCAYDSQPSRWKR
jgi:hypothetical protein